MRPPTPVVREGVPSDAKGIAAIGKVAFPETYKSLADEATIHEIVEQTYALDALRECIHLCSNDENAHFLVAESNDDLVGYLHYDCAGAEPELHRIYVDPEQKRSGIGSALLRELHERLAPGTSYILMVIAGNEPAINFYRRHGFVEQARVDGPTYIREHQGVDLPSGRRDVPALILRFTKRES